MYDGWTPTFETTYEYDDDGRLVRSLTRQVESEWDDTGRALAEGLAQHGREVHAGGCGLHPAILAEPDVYRFTYEDDNCPACATHAIKMRLLAEADEKWREKNEKAPPTARRPSDGRRVHLVPITKPPPLNPGTPKEAT